MLGFPLLQRAELYARAAHQAIGHKRKYTGKPYFTHLRAVADMVAAHGGTQEMIAAAYLHDVLEDTQVEYAHLLTEFGPEVADLVQELTDQFTDPAIGNRAHRKHLERERMSKISPEAQTIKYADVIDNASSILPNDPGFGKVYLTEIRALLEVMDKGDQKLLAKAHGTLILRRQIV